MQSELPCLQISDTSCTTIPHPSYSSALSSYSADNYSLTVNMVSAVQWYEAFESEFGNVKGIQAQPLTLQADQAQPLKTQGHMAQPLLDQGSQPQPQGMQAQPWGIQMQPTAAVLQPLGTDTQPLGFLTQPWDLPTKVSGSPEAQPLGCQTQPLGIRTQPLGVQAPPYAVVSNAQHATVSNMIIDSVLQPDTPNQQEAGLTKNVFGIDHTLPGKALSLQNNNRCIRVQHNSCIGCL